MSSYMEAAAAARAAEAKTEGLLRGACALLAAAAALLVGLNTQTETVLFIRKKATVKDVQALWVLAMAAAAAAGYHLLQLLRCFYLSRFADGKPCRHRRAIAWLCFLLDKKKILHFYSVARRGRSPQPAVAASGVVYQDRLLQQHHALLRPGGEVILSAGSLGSPQLLLLSGIGPANDLTSLGIPVFADVPDVGKHMFDNPRNGISIIPSIPIDHSLIQVVGIPSANGNESYLEAASYIVPLAPILRRGGPFSPSSPLYVTVVTIMEKVPGPLSEGSLWLTSSNPLESPSVRFNYLSRREDLARCVTGMRRVAKVLESTTMDVFRSAMGSLSQDSRRREFRIVGAALPVDWRTNDTALGDFCQQTVATLWHYHGGCVAGSVVDRDFRVFRVRALRVVDGSTFRETPGTNPQATIMMMGRYIGQKMIDERHSRRQVRTSTDSSSNA
ncbi:hypothetical protein OsI_23959 [Oryza sativa Indica Group]|uniref:Glucose-methanol-choline oxidoreductase N-terminal domain-containing protein n=1 Tax=Oryza sativa subsp. indica TaxID=39946 RepID=A2YFS2_ORYSI|nr:hypothetical protein OsI_23959 [Oryza sativa Indica Group]